MRQLSLAIEVTVSMFRRSVAVAATFLRSSLEGPVRKYHPEDHYMRSPGPKWREKHLFGRAPGGT